MNVYDENYMKNYITSDLSYKTCDYSSEASESSSLEEQIIELKGEIAILNSELGHYINAFNALQENLADYENYILSKVDTAIDAVKEHSDSFHAMLIIGNKGGNKDENNIS